jgi:hypothetical protein
MSSNDIPLLERPAFFHYQRLTAADLTAVQRYNRELRWLHNRSLHNWGIAFGFAVSGPRGAQTVRVEPGYAIDCVGHDLVLDKSLEMPIPAVASASDGTPATYYLTISYAEDSELDAVNRSGECNTTGAVRIPELPIVRWQDPSDRTTDSGFQEGHDVVLGAIRVLNCQLADDVSAREQRRAVSSAQPYVAAGRTDSRKTPWQLWPSDTAPLGVATTVATTSGAFQTTPRYQANVVGERLFKEGKVAIAIEGYSEIALATAASFDLRVILPSGSSVGKSQVATVNRDDCKLVVSRIAKANGLSEDLLLTAFGSVGFKVDQKLSDSTGGPLGKLTPADLQKGLTQIATRNGVSNQALLDVNGWTSMKNVFLKEDLIIAVPGPALMLNPKKILKPEFMDRFKNDLNWQVVWMGVED